MNNLNVLYEDNHLMIIEKPFNILSQSDNTNDIDMVNIVKDYLKKKYNKKGNVYLGLVQRLDRPVGGLMIFAKTSKAASRLSQMISSHEIVKEYLTVVNGIMQDKNKTVIDNVLRKNDGTSVINKNGKHAELSYTVIEEKGNNSLLKVFLKTGRHHQIRVQLANLGYPIYGDQLYGKQDKKQIALYCFHLEFVHPVKKEKLNFISYPKISGVWAIFDTINSKSIKNV